MRPLNRQALAKAPPWLRVGTFLTWCIACILAVEYFDTEVVTYTLGVIGPLGSLGILTWQGNWVFGSLSLQVVSGR